MKDVIESARDYKIIPENFTSSAELDVIEITDKTIKAQIKNLTESELQAYKDNAYTEVFATNNLGMVYFETKILSFDNGLIELEMPADYSILQRREYSRVGFNKENIHFTDLMPDVVEDVIDISAGGIKFQTKYEFDCEKLYNLKIDLSGNMKIECKFKPKRIAENNGLFVVSGEFVGLESMDRIVIIQYAFKVQMETVNKG